jgi:hypothetical protein
MPADDRGPRCINCYSVDVERFDAIDGHKFKLDPAGLIYSLQWLHNGTISISRWCGTFLSSGSTRPA